MKQYKKPQKKRENKERAFEKNLKKVASLFGMLYYKIPDTKMLNAYNRNRNKEDKRPFDGILITPKQNYCIECKVNYGKLSDHQKINQFLINNKNGSFYVLRKKFLKNGVFYTIEQNYKIIFKTQEIEELLFYFNKK